MTKHSFYLLGKSLFTETNRGEAFS